MNSNSKILTNAENCFNTEIAALRRTATLLDKNFAKAVKLITQTHAVHVTGIGKSGIIGRKIAATLASIGVTSTFLHPVDALHGDIGMLRPEDIVILISKSGNTVELVTLMPYLKMHKAKTIAIVGNNTSYIANNADIVLDASVEHEACPFGLAPTASTTVALALGDALAVCAMAEMEVSLTTFSKSHPGGQIGRSVTLTVKDVMKPLSEIPILKGDNTLKDAIITMTKKPVGCVCVVATEKELVSLPSSPAGDKMGKWLDIVLIGIITDGDIRRFLSTGNHLELSLKDIMTTNPVVVAPDAQLVEALALMENREHQISVLPVVQQSALVGLVRIHDVL